MELEQIIGALKKIAAKSPRDHFHGQTLRGLRRRKLICRRIDGENYYLTPRGRKLLNQQLKPEK